MPPSLLKLARKVKILLEFYADRENDIGRFKFRKAITPY